MRSERPVDYAGLHPSALKELYDHIYREYIGRESECPVSLGTLAGARKRTRQALRGLGLLSRAHTFRVLDLGCGLGFNAEVFRELGPDVGGVAPSPVGVAQAQFRFRNIDFRCLVFPEGMPEGYQFDLIWAVDLPSVGTD